MKKLNVGTYSKGSRLKQVEKPAGSGTSRPKNGGGRSSRKDRPATRIPVKRAAMVLGGLFFAGMLVFGYMRLQAINARVEKFDEGGNKIECTNILNPECWTDAFKPQLKQTDGFTNGLVVGLDTRTGGSDSLRNTDTIMFFSFNHETQKTMLVSIPRDFYVPVYATKINAIYAFTGDRKPEDPFFYLKETVSDIVGQPIHYFATVRFEGVTEAIDKIGGIEVCIEDTLTAQYPNDEATASSPDQWLFYEFEEGCQQLDGEHALVWSRFRYVRKGPSVYASDFSRARRQQQVLESVKDKLLGEDSSVSEKAEYYWSLIETFSESVTFYDLAFEDILAGLAFLDTADKDPVNVVLDPALGGYNSLIYADSSTSAGYTIRARDESYSAIQSYLESIWKFSDFWKEQPTIVVRNVSDVKLLPDDHPAVALKDDIEFYNEILYYNEEQTDQFAGIKIFDFTAGEVPGSLSWISDYLGVDVSEELPEQYGFERSSKEEDILIVVGPAELPTPTPSDSPEAQ
ncbi:MAG: Regulatory protein MsrR [candidate division WS6 bacterium OLB20]|uniref:Regulatory protein MsrR n=1 Tax=candidate division WS6 bacterium OLB20 TaxID=1617426 RepID=A0A136M072_9BACT|nr:MAG: Regulatory protein MsrR [candidate division WS6 bacterium OLB20]